PLRDRHALPVLHGRLGRDDLRVRLRHAAQHDGRPAPHAPRRAAARHLPRPLARLVVLGDRRVDRRPVLAVLDRAPRLMDARAVPLLPPVPTAAACGRLTVLAVASGAAVAAGETLVSGMPAEAAALTSALLPVVATAAAEVDG